MTNPTTITYGEFTLDVAALPQVSLVALVRGGLAHKMGNEVASRVSTAKEKAKKDGTELTEAQVADLKAGFQKEMFEAIMAGTVGHSARGPAQPKGDSILQRLALDLVKATLKAQNLTLPTGDKTIDLNGTKYTRADLVNAAINGKNKDKLAAAAEKEKARIEKEKAKAAELATDGIF